MQDWAGRLELDSHHWTLLEMTQDLRNKQLIKNTNWDMWTNPQTVRNTHLWGSVSAARCVRAVEPEKRYCADGDLLDPIWANPRSDTPPDQDTLITNTERERDTEQCEQINCILKCVFEVHVCISHPNFFRSLLKHLHWPIRLFDCECRNSWLQ